MVENRPSKPVIVSVQSLLYKTAPSAVERTLSALHHSSFIGRSEGMCDGFRVVLGDGSPSRTLSKELLDEWRARFPHFDGIHYKFFGENVGTSEGHNRLAKVPPRDVEYLVFSNPDVVPDARALWRMAAVFDDPEVGMVEAKQLPIEHPKDYDPETGETSWSSTAFAMTPRKVFDDLEGFDATTFFMYCDDLDYSWRVRERGLKVIMQAAAVVFHDKTLTPDGKWMPTEAERRYSAQAALLLPHKWSREDVLQRYINEFKRHDRPMQREALAEFARRRRKGLLVPQRDPEHRIGTFTDRAFTHHRFWF